MYYVEKVRQIWCDDTGDYWSVSKGEAGLYVLEYTPEGSDSRNPFAEKVHFPKEVAALLAVALQEMCAEEGATTFSKEA